MTYEFRNNTYRSLHVASVAGTARFADGEFSTEDEALGEALRALPDWYGVQLVSAPDEGPEDPPEGGGGSGDGPDDVQRPARSASKADWVKYAVAQGVDAAAADKATRDELAAKYADESSD